MSAPLASKFQIGATVHIYAPSHYNCRGEITAIRESDAQGRFTVRLRNTTEEVAFHECDLEVL